MTTQNNTTSPTPTIRPVAIVYEVQGPRKRKPYRVTVIRTERGDCLYHCDCGALLLYDGCQHTEAVQAERAKQGRK